MSLLAHERFGMVVCFLCPGRRGLHAKQCRRVRAGLSEAANALEFWAADCHNELRVLAFVGLDLCMVWQPCWLVLGLVAMYSLEHVVSRDPRADSLF